MRSESLRDAFYEHCISSDAYIEEKLALPRKEVIEEVCDILLNISCMREEGRYSSFRTCFIPPHSEYLHAFLYAHEYYFETPVNFTPADMHKLAPALNESMSYLMLDTSGETYKATGIITAYTVWERIMTREIPTGNRMPQLPNIMVNGPGELTGCLGENPIVYYHAGSCYALRTDLFTNTIVADKLREDSSVSDEERMRLFSRIIWRIGIYDHGGHIYIVPSAEEYDDYPLIKYKMFCRFPCRDNNERLLTSVRAQEKEIIAYADMIAKFTCVDGAVVLTKDMDMLGFGAETRIDMLNRKKPKMCFIRSDNTEDPLRRYDDNGMRHRTCYTFCDVHDGAVAFILSHDGTIKCCTKHNGKVVVYDHIGLPAI